MREAEKTFSKSAVELDQQIIKEKHCARSKTILAEYRALERLREIMNL